MICLRYLQGLFADIPGWNLLYEKLMEELNERV